MTSLKFPQIDAPVVLVPASASPGIAPCGCSKRTLLPKRPDALTLAQTEENVDKMKAWFLDYFSSSTFNVCPHQPSLVMNTDPIRLISTLIMFQNLPSLLQLSLFIGAKQ